jgi:hypothetical protein
VPDLLVVVLEVSGTAVQAHLAEVDRPGEVLRAAAGARSTDLPADAAAVLGQLAADHLAPRLLALAVAVGADVDAQSADDLVQSLGAELLPGFGLPASLPVVAGSADGWAGAGASAPSRPVVAGAMVAAARSVGAHAHLPRPTAQA